ncbi:PIN domain-containing protein [Mastigocladopsis repens]|uniref:hypothetical protein n=1 Tax=Mastigocladopsis repens TaxID=221287 RepID=UPI0002FD3697|nr:hypothetical protein [Mastigocladopsis repens]
MYAAAEVQADLASLKVFLLHVVSMADLMADAVAIALVYICAYDASYVPLSQQVGATLTDSRPASG